MALNNPHGVTDPDGSRPVTDPTPDPTPDPAAAAALDRAAGELARDTDRDPSPGLLPAVMHTVWAELRPGARIPLPGSDGTLLVTETAVGNALVAHLDGLPELLIHRCTVQHLPATPDQPTADRPTIGITLTAAVAYGSRADALLQRVRTVLTIAADQLFGLTVDRVDIDIVDIYPPVGHPQ